MGIPRVLDLWRWILLVAVFWGVCIVEDGNAEEPEVGAWRIPATRHERAAARPGRHRLRDFFVRRVRWFQKEPPLDTPAGDLSTTEMSTGAPLPATEPGGPGQPSMETELAPPEKPATMVAPAPTPLLLNKALGFEDKPYRVYGWIQNSFTGNANGLPRNRVNFGVYPNHLADQWEGNQYYLVLENPLNMTDTVNFGFRADLLFGYDWQFTKDYGLFDRAWPDHWFPGIDLPQFYGEVHLPILTPRGLDIRAGRFYSLTGYESPMAIGRPLLSVPYSMNYTPFTFFGAYAKLNLSDRFNIFSGSITGFDRFPNEPYKWGYIGGLNWTSHDDKINLVIGGASAYDQLPIFPPPNAQDLPVGVPGPGFLSRRPNPFYNKSMRGYIVGVLSYKWSEKLTEVIETNDVWDPEILGYGAHPYRPTSAAYHGLVHWFLYQITPKVTGVWRSEIFWDPYGLATGNADNYHEITLGLLYKPRDDLWIRPEVRYDWSQFTHPFSDGTRSSQLTMAFDVIFLF